MKPQIEVIADLLRAHKTVTLRMLFDAGVGYTARNRISDLRKMGWDIAFIKHAPALGQTPSDNMYMLVGEPIKLEKLPAFDEQNQAVMPL